MILFYLEKSWQDQGLANGTWELFFSAAPTAQNSPKLHFRFMNSFFQSSLLRSLLGAVIVLEAGIFTKMAVSLAAGMPNGFVLNPISLPYLWGKTLVTSIPIVSMLYFLSTLT